MDEVLTRGSRFNVQEQRDRLAGYTVHFPFTEALAELVVHLNQGDSVTIWRRLGKRHLRMTVEVEV